MNIEQIRRLTIEADSKGFPETTANLNKLTGAYDANSKAAANNGTVNDTSAKRALSVAEAYRRQGLQVDIAMRQQDQFARAQRVTDAALQQGVIGVDQHTARMELLRKKYLEAGEGTVRFSAATALAQQALLPLTSLMSATAAIQFARSAFDNAAALNEQAEQAGASVEAFQARNAVMLESGIASTQAAAAQVRLTRSIGDALYEAGPARDAFQSLGVGALTLKQGLDAAMPAVAAALLQIPDASERARIEVELLGKSGQRLESALRTLSEPTATLIQREMALGQVLGRDVTTAADQASDALERSWNALRNSATPAIVGTTGALRDMVDWMNTVVSSDTFFTRMEKLAAGMYNISLFRLATGPMDVAGPGSSMNSAPTTSVGTSKNPGGYSTPGLQAAIAQQAQLDALAGETGAKRAADLAIMQLGATALKDLGDKQAHINSVMDAESAITRALVSSHGDIGRAEAARLITSTRNNAELKITSAAYDHVKETFAGYLAQLDQAAVAAGLTTREQRDQAAIIKAAQIDEKAHGIAARDISQSYAAAVVYLGQAQVQQVQNRLTLADTNTVQRDLNDQINQAIVLGKTSITDRAAEAQYLALSAKYGREVADAARDQLQTLQAINAVNAARDQVNARDADIERLKALGSLRGDPTADQGRLQETMDNHPINRALSQMDQQIGSGMAMQPDAKFADDIKQANALELARTNALKDALAARSIMQDEYNARTLAVEQDHARSLAAIDQAQQAQRLGFASDFFGNMATLSQSSNQTLSAIGKAAAIIQAEIDGVTAVQKALSAYPPPWNFVMAAAVEVAVQANVAKIAGFEQGGFTGYGPRDAVAGVVHRQEWVTHADATAANRTTLAAMNAGASFDRLFAAQPATANSNASPIKVTINNNAGVAVSAERMSDDEILVTIDQVSTAKVHSETPKVFRDHLNSTDSTISRALESRTTTRLHR